MLINWVHSNKLGERRVEQPASDKMGESVTEWCESKVANLN